MEDTTMRLSNVSDINLRSDDITHSQFVSTTHNSPKKATENESVRVPNLSDQNDSEVIKRLQKQNERLRSELKSLSDQLTVVLSNQKKPKDTERYRTSQDLGKEELKKELENAQKQLQISARDIKNLKTKVNFSYDGERFQELETKFRESEKTIENLVKEKKSLEKISRDQERQLSSSQVLGGNPHFEEMKGLRQKIRELEERDQKNEKASQKKHEYYVTIEEKYRELCRENGTDPLTESTMAQARALKSPGMTSNKAINTKTERNTKKDLNVSIEDEPVELTEDKFKRLQNTIRILKKAHFSNDKKHKTESDQFQNRIKDLEYENKELTARIRDKEKENNIMNSKINEMKRTFKNAILSPLDDVNPVSSNSFLKGSQSTRNGTSKIHNTGGMRKDEKGKAVGNARLFTDQDLLSDVTQWKISGFKVWYSANYISGFMANYRDSVGEFIEGNMNVSNQGKGSYKEEDIEFGPGDFLKEISGTLDKSESHVQSLMFVSAQGDTQKVGKPDANAKTFRFDINEYEYPAIMYGGLDIEYDSDRTEIGSKLCKIGVLIKSDAIEELIEPPEGDTKRGSQKRIQKPVQVKSALPSKNFGH